MADMDPDQTVPTPGQVGVHRCRSGLGHLAKFSLEGASLACRPGVLHHHFRELSTDVCGQEGGFGAEIARHVVLGSL